MAKSKRKIPSAYRFVGYSVAVDAKGKRSLHFHTSAREVDEYAVFMKLPGSASFHWFALPPKIDSKEKAARYLAAKKLPSDVKKYLAERAEALAE